MADTSPRSRLALVVGAASGIGRATAARLERDGYRVISADRAVSSAADAARWIALDVASEASVDAAFARVEAEHGSIDALLNFAGILNASGSHGKTLLADIDTDEWDAVHAVNARGSFYLVRAFARARAARPVAHGRVVLTASVVGQMGGLQAGAAYSASKGAVLALAKSAARELAARNITVNCIAPGAVDTPMMRMSVPEARRDEGYQSLAAIPLGRVGTPEEIAAAAAFLISEDAGFLTGATIDANGGMLMR